MNRSSYFFKILAIFFFIRALSIYFELLKTCVKWMIQHDMFLYTFYIPQLKIVFHYEKKEDKTIAAKLYNNKFL